MLPSKEGRGGQVLPDCAFVSFGKSFLRLEDNGDILANAGEVGLMTPIMSLVVEMVSSCFEAEVGRLKAE